MDNFGLLFLAHLIFIFIHFLILTFFVRGCLHAHGFLILKLFVFLKNFYNCSQTTISACVLSLLTFLSLQIGHLDPIKFWPSQTHLSAHGLSLGLKK